MNNKPTIDGVPRELLESFARDAAYSPNAIMRLRASQAQAMLDAPKCVADGGEVERLIALCLQKDAVISEMNRIYTAAQPQGEPTNKCGQCGSETVQSCNDRGCHFFESGNGEPSSKPQGEPVSYEPAKENKQFEAWARTQSQVDLRLCDIGLYCERKTGLAHDAWQYRAKLSEQPAPVAVVLPERKTWDGLRATACNLKGEAWNACLDEVTRLNAKS